MRSSGPFNHFHPPSPLQTLACLARAAHYGARARFQVTVITPRFQNKTPAFPPVLCSERLTDPQSTGFRQRSLPPRRVTIARAARAGGTHETRGAKERTPKRRDAAGSPPVLISPAATVRLSLSVCPRHAAGISPDGLRC